MQKKLDAALRDAGYTDEDYELDKAFAGEELQANKVAINCTLNVELTPTGFRITSPQADMASVGGVTLQKLSLLPNFSRFCYGTNGYYLLPDGSGSIMNFFNDRNQMQMYSVNIYGEEDTIKEKETVFNTQQAILPLFGCHAENAGWL